MIISLIQKKGGTGKSTITAHLAAELHSRGYSVLIVDSDPQGTVLTWSEVATESALPSPPVVAVGDNLRQVVPNLAKNYDITIIDTSGHASKRIIGALMLSDVALLPCPPSPADIWAMAETIESIESAKELKPELEAYTLINRKSNTTIGKSTRDALSQTVLPILDTSLGQRVAYVDALSHGKGVTDYASHSEAANEMRCLASEIETKFMGGSNCQLI